MPLKFSRKSWHLCDRLGENSVAVFTPHAQRERGKVIGYGVHMFVNEKNI